MNNRQSKHAGSCSQGRLYLKTPTMVIRAASLSLQQQDTTTADPQLMLEMLTGMTGNMEKNTVCGHLGSAHLSLASSTSRSLSPTTPRMACMQRKPLSTSTCRWMMPAWRPLCLLLMLMLAPAVELPTSNRLRGISTKELPEPRGGASWTGPNTSCSAICQRSQYYLYCLFQERSIRGEFNMGK